MRIAWVMSLAMRALALAIIAASPWLAPRSRASEARSVVYVVDRSASVGEVGLGAAQELLGSAWKERGDADLGVVAFDGSAELVAPVGALWAPVIRASPEAWASDLAGAIRVAAAALPGEGHRSIVLLTDARPTRGDAASEVRRAAERGIRVDVVPIGGAAPTQPTIVSVTPRSSHVAEHQPVTLDVQVRAAESYVIEWTRDGVRMPPVQGWVMPYEADLASDPSERGDLLVPSRTIELRDPSPPPGIHVYEVKAALWPRRHEPGTPEPPSTPPVLAAVSVDGRGRAVVFSSAGSTPPVLADALAESGVEGQALPLERAADPSFYAGTDLVVLSDVRVTGAANDDTALTRSAQAALVEYVQRGGGLLVTGGVFGLAPEYAGTPIARVVPVEIEDRGHVEDPPVALAIMLDRSGSMRIPVGAYTKIQLAVEASLAAADTLRLADQVAIGSVDEETHWNVPLGPVDRLAALRASVREVTASGGGIYVYTAMRDAYAALASVRAPIRHVILFSDTSDSEEQVEGCPFDPCATGKTAEALAREARAHGITTTVVGIGDGQAKDTEFLRRVAAAAGGRFYLSAEGSDLRSIFLSETRVLAQSNLREQRTRVSVAGSHPLLEGIDASKLPELSAYVETGRRAGADTALVVPDPSRPDGRPVLATWRYGLGKAGAITTDLYAGWGEAWAASPEAAELLRRTVRFLLRQAEARRADAEIRVRDRAVEVDVELSPDAPEGASPSALDVFAIGEGGASRKLAMRLEPIGPGRFRARGRSRGEPVIVARATDARGALMAEAVGREDHATELSGDGPDVRLAEELARLGEGRIGPSAVDTLAPTARPARRLEPTWPYALLVAAALVVVDLVLRRLGEPRPGRERDDTLTAGC